jgi:hypothetical protein
MGNDLAVMDSAGRILLYTTGFTLTSMALVHTAVPDSVDEMNEVVGMHWLPVFPHTQKVRLTILFLLSTISEHMLSSEVVVCGLLVSIQE